MGGEAPAGTSGLHMVSSVSTPDYARFDTLGQKKNPDDHGSNDTGRNQDT